MAASKRPKGARRSTLGKTQGEEGSHWIVFAAKGLFSTIILFWIGAWFFLSGGSANTTEWISQGTLNLTANMGFQVQDILVEGRERSDRDALLATINVRKGDPIFAFNPREAQKQITQLSWVKSALVERRLPGTVYIGLQERQPLALWKEGDKLVLIDREGVVLTDKNLSEFSNYIMIGGENAIAHAPELLDMLSAEPLIKEKADSASWIGNRRWNIVTTDSKLIKLPENDIGLALRSLALAQEKEKILDKDISVVDLREPGRLIIRTEAGKAQEFIAGQKTDMPL